MQLDLRQSGDKLCFVTNTEERAEEFVRELDEALRTKMLPRSEGEKLRGRLQFASSQVQKMAESSLQPCNSGRKTLSQHTQSCLSDIRELLTQNTPRRIEASQAEVLHIYVDASFDYSDYCGLGGMIVDMSKKVISFFSVEADRRTLDDVMAKGQKTVIQELEMMAVLAAMKVWKRLIKACRVVMFTDSEAVRGAFLKSWSANDDSDKMIDIIFQVESDFDVPVWIERVPSQSNPADILSRETVVEFERAEKAEVEAGEMWSLLTK